MINIDKNRQKCAVETLGMAYFGHPVGGKFFINKIAIEIGLLSEFKTMKFNIPSQETWRGIAICFFMASNLKKFVQQRSKKLLKHI